MNKLIKQVLPIIVILWGLSLCLIYNLGREHGVKYVYEQLTEDGGAMNEK